MFGKSIYKKLAEDFAFVKDFGFEYSSDLRHYVTPSILYKENRYKIGIGFSHEDDRFFVNLFDSTKKRYSSKETIEKFERLNPHKEYPFKDGLDECKNILEGITLIGKSYKEQVEQVKTILHENLQKLMK